MKRLRIGLGGLALAGCLAQAGIAEAAPCSDQQNPIYVSASGNHKALLKQASAVLRAASSPVTIVFQSYVSCAALDLALSNGATKATNTALYWNASGAETACEIPAGGIDPDAVMSDVYASTCERTLPSNLKDFLGPIQVMTFVVPPTSSETAISAEAAYVTFGFGGAPYPVAPWTDPASLFIRPDTAGTKLLIAKAIELPAGKWRGTPRPTAGDVLTSVVNAVNPNATLGIITTELSDTYRSPVDGKQLKTLAYRHRGQSCGYYPDASSTVFDKLNVREGRYPLWGPFHVVAPVDGGGNPTNGRVAQFVNVLQRRGITEPEKKSMTDAEIAAHAVPNCAMKVQRTAEMEVPKPFTPDEPCGCYFDSKTGGTSKTCTACTDDGGCSGATPKCRFGFCEAK
jgi:hypothetical protein